MDGAEDSIGGHRRWIWRSGPPARLGRLAERSTTAHHTRPEDRLIDLNAAVEPVVGAVVIGLGLAALVLLILIIAQARQVRRLQRRLDSLTRGVDGRNLDAVLDAHLDKVSAVANELDDLSARSAMLEAVSRRTIQKVGLVRFNPFEDTGGNQSFAIALTDAAGTGFIISSLHTRTGTRVYAKAIAEGRSDGALSEEEAKALRQAMSAPAPTASGVVRPSDRAPGAV